MHPVLADIDNAVETNARIVEGVKTDQWELSTPCVEWTVRDVLNHTVGGMHIFAAELTGTGPVADHESDWLGTDPVTAYRTAADVDRAAWRLPDVLDRTVSISLGTLPGPMAALVHLTEVLVHGCDVAVATGQEHLVDEAACERLLAGMAGMGGVDAFRAPGVFGPEVPSPDGAQPHERLLAYLGRRV
jgi:uncharacterized protein (TIGR03086 family)